MDEKKKRGSNYTPAEKDMLLELIKKYQDIIENKETNANIIIKKREAWDSVCQQYNAVAVSGCRTWQQLRHLYENLKQRSKKNIAKANRLQYYDNTIEVKKKASHDKKEINRTGGGAYKSVITEQDAQILAMVAPQIQPLANSYDDAATYFGDTEAKTQKTESRVTSPELIYTYKIDDQDITMADSSKSCTSINILSDDQGAATAIKPTEKNKPQPSTSASATATEIIPIEKSKPPPSTYARKVKPKSMSIKEQYFKTKLRNAKLENKYLINKHKMEINKYKLEIQILKLRLQKLKKSI